MASLIRQYQRTMARITSQRTKTMMTQTKTTPTTPANRFGATSPTALVHVEQVLGGSGLFRQRGRGSAGHATISNKAPRPFPGRPLPNRFARLQAADPRPQRNISAFDRRRMAEAS